MTRHETEDLTMAQLARLVVLEPDAARAERHRVHCRRAIARWQLPASGSRRAAAFIGRVIEPVLVGALCLGYLSGAIYDVLRLLEAR